MKDRSEESVDAARHLPTQDPERINRAVEKASSNPDFIDHAAGKLADLRFPAFKHAILEHAKSVNAGGDVISLFDSLDGYIEYRDQYHIYKALQENVASKKREFQITDRKRESPDFRVRQTSGDVSTKDLEAVNESEERKDYPEVTSTAMSIFVCDRCGKDFQSQDDLIHHKRFEGGGTVA